MTSFGAQLLGCGSTRVWPPQNRHTPPENSPKPRISVAYIIMSSWVAETTRVPCGLACFGAGAFAGEHWRELWRQGSWLCVSSAAQSDSCTCLRRLGLSALHLHRHNQRREFFVPCLTLIDTSPSCCRRLAIIITIASRFASLRLWCLCSWRVRVHVGAVCCAEVSLRCVAHD